MLKRTIILFLLFLLKNTIGTAQNNSIQIEVKDKKSHEYLPFANVQIRSQTGCFKNTTTDLAGKADVTGLLPGTYSVEIFYLGYERDSSSIVIRSGKPKTVTIEMVTAAIICSEVVIVANTNTDVTYNIIRCGRGCFPWIEMYPLSKMDSVNEEVQNKMATPTIKCYPNPTTGMLYVEPIEQIKELYVVDVSGKLIAQYNLQEEQKMTLDLSEYAPGIYFLSYLNEGKFYSEKVIVVH